MPSSVIGKADDAAVTGTRSSGFKLPTDRPSCHHAVDMSPNVVSSRQYPHLSRPIRRNHGIGGRDVSLMSVSSLSVSAGVLCRTGCSTIGSLGSTASGSCRRLECGVAQSRSCFAGSWVELPWRASRFIHEFSSRSRFGRFHSYFPVPRYSFAVAAEVLVADPSLAVSDQKSAQRVR